MTARLARGLRRELEPQGLEVLCSHGQTGVDPSGSLGKLRAWYGPAYTKRAILADLDIAIVSQPTGQLIALVEVEETSAKPKLLVGDGWPPCSATTFRSRENSTEQPVPGPA